MSRSRELRELWFSDRYTKDFLETNLEGQLFIAHCEDTNKQPFKRKILADHKVTILIGPEGDFSTKEREQIKMNKNFKSFSLGNNILRSETAAIAGLVLLNFLLN